MIKLYMALLHYPAYNKNKEIVATSIVIHDLHDMSRAARTYGVKTFYVVQPMEEQKKVVSRIVHFWQTVGYEYNPNRLDAISVMDVKDSLFDVIKEIERKEGEKPLIIGTSAKEREKLVTYEFVSRELKNNHPVLVCFGTGWGIPEEFERNFDGFFPPIVGITDFNHLSVRSATSIILDRIINTYKSCSSNDSLSG
ncbi:MAG: RNA methyltransferase [Caldisericum exile]|uniref:RNA methyltransferase n=1 Tax=Caldisericum exile TaxID=693075 RepID=UPI003C71A87E